MKTSFVAIAIFLSAHLQNAEAAVSKFDLDLKKSSVRWTGKFLLNSGIHAEMKFKSGQFLLQNGVRSGRLTADMQSVKTDTGLDTEIKGPMALNTKTFPTSTLVIQRIETLQTFVAGGPNARVVGTLTFRGQSYPVQTHFILTSDSKGFHAVGSVPTAYGQLVDGELTYEVWTK